MASVREPARFEKLTQVDVSCPTLVEGLPGVGLVASLVADQVTRQLELEHYGSIHCPEFPPVASFEDGRVRDLVRVYAGSDPPVLTLQSDLAVPPASFESLAQCVLSELAPEFDCALFLAGAPAGSDEDVGEVAGIATTDRLEAELRDAGVDLADGAGFVGGVTGALLNACYRGGVPAAVLVVGADPVEPDPRAAGAVIDQALRPFVEFDVETAELWEHADRIRERMRPVAQQYRETEQGQERQQAPVSPSMYR